MDKATRYRLEYKSKSGQFQGCNHFDTLEIAERHGWAHHNAIEASINSKHDGVNRMFTVWEV